MIRVFLQESGDGQAVVSLEINNEATIQNLISAYCAKRGVGYSSSLVILDSRRNTLPLFPTLKSLGVSDGQTLYVGREKKSTSMDKRWIFILTVIIISIFILAIILMASFYATSGGVIPFDFGVVMDGGSTKTNVIVYKWAGDKHKGTGCVRQAHSCKAEGGIAKAENVSYVLPCMNEAKGRIKSSSLPSTPLYFASTAGMRLLRLEDKEKANNLLDELEALLNKTGMSLRIVEIISGADEGKYDWITANFLKDTLEKEPEENPWRPATIGALDMGGASAQIAFALEPKENNTDPEVETVELYGQKHAVFASSSLCFGRDYAEKRHRALLVEDPTDLNDVTDPCSPKDYRYNVTGKELFSDPCTKSPQFDEWIKSHPNIKDQNVYFVGSGDHERCSKAVENLVNLSACENRKFKECFKKINKQVQNQKFLAFATYFYTTLGLNLTKSSYQEFENGTKSYCSRNVSDVDPSNRYAPNLCFNACFMFEVLVTGYGFNNETWSNIEFLGKIDGKDVSWPIGYMIKATNIIPEKKPSPKFTTVGAFAACMVIFIFIVIVAGAFLAYNFGRKSTNHYSFQNA